METGSRDGLDMGENSFDLGRIGVETAILPDCGPGIAELGSILTSGFHTASSNRNARF